MKPTFVKMKESIRKRPYKKSGSGPNKDIFFIKKKILEDASIVENKK